jgi:hypothetical protein
MIFGKKNQNILRNIDDKNIKIMEIYKKGGKVFQLFCDVTKSDGTIGQNINYCLKLLTDQGFVVILDNRTMDIPEVKMSMNEQEILMNIEEGFEKFKQFADILI